MKYDLTGLGLVVAIIVWVTLMVIMASSFSCLDSKWNCGSGELFTAGLLGVGFSVPAFIAGLLLSHKRKGQ